MLYITHLSRCYDHCCIRHFHVDPEQSGCCACPELSGGLNLQEPAEAESGDVAGAAALPGGAAAPTPERTEADVSPPPETAPAAETEAQSQPPPAEPTPLTDKPDQASGSDLGTFC